MAAAALLLLAACGRSGSAPGQAGQSGTAETARCFVAVGSLDDQDAKLFAAAQAGDVPAVEQALATGANINAADRLKRTPLLAAAFCNQAGVANLLIDKGGDVNAGDF
ncbi:MAG TPA: ankyrin repeat domain-containing protein, partial [Rhodocyclaceae bacterium]|nr:ankyrin repeat domain-containing protein [Rhodocyclaceae bacterium]